MPSFLKFALIVVVAAEVSGCSFLSKRSNGAVKPDAATAQTAVDRAAEELSLKQLDQAMLVFRVAFEKANDTWQGAGDDTVPGCKIISKDAENGLAAVKPWLDRRVREEGERAGDNPKIYRVPIDEETCDRDCTCGLGVKILEAAQLDKQSHAQVKDLKRLRTRFEAKSELLTNERAELCAENATWVCKSDLLKTLRNMP